MAKRRKMAIVATAKKLLKIIWHLVLTGEEYVGKDGVTIDQTIILMYTNTSLKGRRLFEI